MVARFSFRSCGGSENGSNVSPRRPDPNLEIPMKALSALLLTALFAGTAVAAPTCTVPQDKWMKEADLKAGAGYF